MMRLAIFYLLAANVIAFAAYGLDKWKARRSKWRIPEATLLWLAALGGALGAWLGMKVFHHKTQHLKFKKLVPLFLLLWIVAIGYIIYQMQLK